MKKVVKPSMLQQLRYDKKMAPYTRIEYISGKTHKAVEFEGGK